MRPWAQIALYLLCGAAILGGCSIAGLIAGYVVLLGTMNATLALAVAGCAGAYTLYAASRAVRADPRPE